MVRLDGTTSLGSEISCATMVYVSPDAEGFFLSLEAMVDLGLINRSSELCPNELSGDVSSHEGVSFQRAADSGSVQCDCPQRTGVPSRPAKLPFSIDASNNEKMKEWLLERFRSSTFNTCPCPGPSH